MPTAEDLAEVYADYYTHAEVACPAWMERLYANLRSAVLSRHFGYVQADAHRLATFTAVWQAVRDRMGAEVMWLKSRSKGRLLDVGCGSGRFAAFMDSLGWRVQGVEPDPLAAQVASETHGLQVHQGGLYDAALPEGAFDAITMNHVIEHIREPVKTLKRVRMLLAKNGRFVVTTPNAAGWGHCHFRQDWMGLDVPRHLHLYTRASLTSLAQQAGLRILETRTTGRCAVFFLAVSRTLRRARASGGARDYRSLLATTKRQPICLILYQLWESVLMTLNGNWGEELLLVAARQ